MKTPAALSRMADPRFMVESLQDDVALQLYAVALDYTRELDRMRVSQLAIHLGYSMDWDDPAKLQRQAQELLDRYSLEAKKFTLKKVGEFARQNSKQVLVVLFDPYRAMKEMRQDGTRYDQPVVDYLSRAGWDYFDRNQVHLRDFANYNLSFDEYMKLYFIGHYNPRGNHFFAYSIKDQVVSWLDPRPIPYRNRDEGSVDFQDDLKTIR